MDVNAIRRIDEQHDELLDVVNDFMTAVSRGDPSSVQVTALDRIIASARDHFTDEEAMMRQNHYPDADNHARIHAELLAQVARMRERLHTPGGNISSNEAERFFQNWLAQHMTTADALYRAFLQDLGPRA